MLWTIISIVFALVALLLAIIIINFLFYRKAYIDSAKQLNAVMESSPYRKYDATLNPRNDFLARDQEIEQDKQDALENGVIKYNEHKIELGQSQEESRIVGIVEPQGFWSKFVISQKLGYIMARMTAQESGHGFWTNLIKAQSASQGKDQSRGR